MTISPPSSLLDIQRGTNLSGGWKAHRPPSRFQQWFNRNKHGSSEHPFFSIGLQFLQLPQEMRQRAHNVSQCLRKSHSGFQLLLQGRSPAATPGSVPVQWVTSVHWLLARDGIFTLAWLFQDLICTQTVKHPKEHVLYPAEGCSMGPGTKPFLQDKKYQVV